MCVYVCVCVVEVIIVSSRATQAGLKSKHKATTGIKAAIETNKQTRQKALTDIAGGQASRQTDKMANRSSWNKKNNNNKKTKKQQQQKTKPKQNKVKHLA